MFDAKKENADAVSRAIEVLSKYGPGDVVPHFELAQAIGSNQGESRYYQVANKARRRHCAATGVWSTPAPGVGFRLLTPAEQITEEQHRRAGRARRQIGIANTVAEAVPDSKLTHHQRKIKAFRLESHKQIAKAIRAEERQANWLLRPTEGVRRPKIHAG